MEPLSLNGKYVLVTGASSGLGRELAREVARRHAGHPILVARRRDRLEELARELEPAGVKALCITADLSKPEDVERVFREATDGRQVHGAILNAGVTYFGRHLEMPEAEGQALIATNVLSVVKLANEFLKHQRSTSPGGGVMVISSLVGNSPTPYQSLYAGSKAFLNQWGVSLATELRGGPTSLTVVACGGIATPMLDTSGTGRVYKKGSLFVMDPDVVARQALAAFTARRRYLIPGVVNLIIDTASRFGPRILVAQVTKVAMSLALPEGQKQA